MEGGKKKKKKQRKKKKKAENSASKPSTTNVCFLNCSAQLQCNGLRRCSGDDDLTLSVLRCSRGRPRTQIETRLQWKERHVRPGTHLKGGRCANIILSLGFQNNTVQSRAARWANGQDREFAPIRTAPPCVSQMALACPGRSDNPSAIGARIPVNREI